MPNKIQTISLVELYLSPQFVFLDAEAQDVNDLCVNNGLSGINIFGNILHQFEDLENRTNLYLNVDLPFNQNDPGARVALIDYYADNYCLSGLNIPIYKPAIINERYSWIQQDLQQILRCVNPEQLRIFLDIGYLADEESQKIISICEDEGVSKIFLGITGGQLSFTDFLISSNILKKNVNDTTQIGVFGPFSKWEHLERMEKDGFDRIIMGHNNIIDIISQNSV